MRPLLFRQAMHVMGSRPFTTFTYRKFYSLTFVQGAESFAHDGGVMNKNVTPGVTVNKTVPFVLIKPFDCTCFLIFHFYFLT